MYCCQVMARVTHSSYLPATNSAGGVVASIFARSPSIIPVIANVGLHLGMQGQPFTGLHHAIVEKGFAGTIVAKVHTGIAGFTTHKVRTTTGSGIAKCLLFRIGSRQEPRASLFSSTSLSCGGAKGGSQVVVAGSRSGRLRGTIVARFHASTRNLWFGTMNVLLAGTQKEPRAGARGHAVRI